jgi:CheY-like chemotaxis protein
MTTMNRVYNLDSVDISDVAKTVLLLDDDSKFVELLRTFLLSQGFRVTCVTTGAEGLRRIMSADFDVILCDLVMPTLPGDMFYLAVERIKPRLCPRFIFISGHGADPKWGAFIRRVRRMVLWKPFSMLDLMTAICTVLEKNRPAPRALVAA